jgi:glycosyltransferase involved in cell wall biosynthesis
MSDLTTNTSITIITPCCRSDNLPKLFESIDFTKIAKWIIVYDISRDRKYKYQFNHPQIVEMECDKVGAYGHPQRNVGIKQVEDGFIYFLDDDNVIHPGFWELIGPLDPTKFYTFDQQRTASSVLRGNVIRVGHIDTAMFLVHKQQIRAIKWVENKYEADGLFISAIARTNPGAHVYVPQIACYYNFLCT